MDSRAGQQGWRTGGQSQCGSTTADQTARTCLISRDLHICCAGAAGAPPRQLLELLAAQITPDRRWWRARPPGATTLTGAIPLAVRGLGCALDGTARLHAHGTALQARVQRRATCSDEGGGCCQGSDETPARGPRIACPKACSWHVFLTFKAARPEAALVAAAFLSANMAAGGELGGVATTAGDGDVRGARGAAIAWQDLLRDRGGQNSSVFRFDLSAVFQRLHSSLSTATGRPRSLYASAMHSAPPAHVRCVQRPWRPAGPSLSRPRAHACL